MAYADAPMKAPESGPQAWLLAGEQTGEAVRLHLNHGPIDLLIEATGAAGEVQAAYRQAVAAFATVLETLTGQLPLLRRTLDEASGIKAFNGDVARRMFCAASPCSAYSVTPMIAVAGAVADHVLTAMCRGRTLQRVLVNNGGDIALHLAPGTHCRIGVCPSTDSTRYDDVITLHPNDGVSGVATSGWRGRSHSLGIADAVTVLAGDAARADVAATLIANATDLPDSDKVGRVAANSLNPDSDLGERQVTVSVAALPAAGKAQALRSGVAFACELLESRLIVAAYLNVQGQTRMVGAHPNRAARLENIEPLSARTGT